MVHLFFFSVTAFVNTLSVASRSITGIMGFCSVLHRALAIVCSFSASFVNVCLCVCDLSTRPHSHSPYWWLADWWLPPPPPQCLHCECVRFSSASVSCGNDGNVPVYPLFSAFSFIVHLLTLNMNVWERKKEGGKERRFSLTKKVWMNRSGG